MKIKLNERKNVFFVTTFTKLRSFRNHILDKSIEDKNGWKLISTKTVLSRNIQGQFLYFFKKTEVLFDGTGILETVTHITFRYLF